MNSTTIGPFPSRTSESNVPLVMVSIFSVDSSLGMNSLSFRCRVVLRGSFFCHSPLPGPPEPLHCPDVDQRLVDRGTTLRVSGTGRVGAPLIDTDSPESNWNRLYRVQREKYVLKGPLQCLAKRGETRLCRLLYGWLYGILEEFALQRQVAMASSSLCGRSITGVRN